LLALWAHGYLGEQGLFDRQRKIQTPHIMSRGASRAFFILCASNALKTMSAAQTKQMPHMSKRFRKRLLWIAAIVLFLIYVSSYAVITQHRYEQFRSYNALGFWYASWEDETSDSWERKERVFGVVYGPLNYVEYDILGFGMPHASCSPFFSLGK
jgi:hypothetical protein